MLENVPIEELIAMGQGLAPQMNNGGGSESAALSIEILDKLQAADAMVDNIESCKTAENPTPISATKKSAGGFQFPFMGKRAGGHLFNIMKRDYLEELISKRPGGHLYDMMGKRPGGLLYDMAGKRAGGHLYDIMGKRPGGHLYNIMGKRDGGLLYDIMGKRGESPILDEQALAQILSTGASLALPGAMSSILGGSSESSADTGSLYTILDNVNDLIAKLSKIAITN